MTNPTTDPIQSTTPAADLVSAIEAFVDAKFTVRSPEGWNPINLGAEIQCRQRLVYLVSRAMKSRPLEDAVRDAQVAWRRVVDEPLLRDYQNATVEIQEMRQAIDEAERDAVKWEKAVGELEERLVLAQRRVGELEDQIVTNQKAEAQHFAAAALLEQHGYALDVMLGAGLDSIRRRTVLRPATDQRLSEAHRALRTWRRRRHAANKEGDA